MASLSELARDHTELDADSIRHLQRLVAAWSLLADLSFSDLVLYAPSNGAAIEFTVLAHVRSTTGPTVHPADPVGETISSNRYPHLRQAISEQQLGEDHIRGTVGIDPAADPDVIAIDGPPGATSLVVDSVPVRRGDRMIAVLCREAEPSSHRHPSLMERVYRGLFDRIGLMVHAGEFPYERFERIGEFREPRVGDGVLVLDREGRIEYGSPNAISALHRLGVQTNIEGRRLRDLGLDDTVVGRAVSLRRSTVAELEHEPDVSVVARCYPLIQEGSVDGAIALLRDISELRHRDRLLLSKDATIQEIHHRVKNNLQTISALLRLQARRLGNVEAKAAVEESVRRISSIALVHEALALDTADAVDFDRVVVPVIRMIEDAMGDPERPVRVETIGSLGEVAGDVAMPMAVVVNELVQNSIDHAGPAGGQIDVEMSLTATDLVLKVSDRGPGVPEGFSLDRDAGLGLTIVRTFVVHDLGGTVRIQSASAQPPRGTVVEVTVPRSTSDSVLGGVGRS